MHRRLWNDAYRMRPATLRRDSAPLAVARVANGKALIRIHQDPGGAGTPMLGPCNGAAQMPLR